MMTPATSPVMTENDMPSQFSIPRTYMMTKVAAAMSTALMFVPKPSDFRSWLMPAFSFVLTVNIPMTDRITPTAAISIGAKTAFICIDSPAMKKAEAPRAMVARMEPQ